MQVFDQIVKTVTHELEAVNEYKKLPEHKSIYFSMLFGMQLVDICFSSPLLLIRLIFVFLCNCTNLLHYEMTVISPQIMEYLIN